MVFGENKCRSRVVDEIRLQIFIVHQTRTRSGNSTLLIPERMELCTRKHPLTVGSYITIVIERFLCRTIRVECEKMQHDFRLPERDEWKTLRDVTNNYRSDVSHEIFIT